eukprot:TsM_000948100 transcript=TsM_000948100 gene=TsM_000948100
MPFREGRGEEIQFLSTSASSYYLHTESNSCCPHNRTSRSKMSFSEWIDVARSALAIASTRVGASSAG